MTLAARHRELAGREQPHPRDVQRFHLCPRCQQVNPWPVDVATPPPCPCEKTRSAMRSGEAGLP